GSVFKNPQGHSSWKLVNDAGLKSHRIGGAMVSDLHTNFIVNAGDARSADIRELIEFIRETVYIKFGVMLEPEVRLVGEF
ncbi:MAG: UDP-N-acetylenolpyruvoylglucosamine reductase, partial [Spirochaetales bacterium]